MSEMTPREIVSELNKHIIGQDNAKRSVAIALRNRWRRMQLDEELRHEVTPQEQKYQQIKEAARVCSEEVILHAGSGYAAISQPTGNDAGWCSGGTDYAGRMYSLRSHDRSVHTARG
jgi:hypothetical protein